MSIIYTCDIGWFISHESIINRFYHNIREFHVNVKADLFKINVPYKNGNKNKKLGGKSRSINSNSSLNQLQVQIGEEISFVKTSFKNLKAKLEENELAIKNANDSEDSNSAALRIAELVYKTTEEHAIKNAHGANMGNPIVKEFKNQKYLFPQNAVFHCENISVLPEHIKTKYDLIVLDPPWWNKYIRRKRSKSGSAYDMMYNTDLANIPIQNLLNDDGLVVTWCTNSPQNYKALVEDVFKKWDIKFASKWYWIKVTKNLDPVCNFSDPLKKQPFEQIIFGCRNVRQLPNPLDQKLVVSVPSILHSHKPPLIGVNIPCFEDNLPGKDWLRHFLKRNVELSTRLAENTKRCKAALSEESVNNYFDELEQTVSGIPPENMVNYDETNLPDDPGRERIIAKKGVKHARRTLDSSKSSVSIMIAASASGILLPPYVVYKSKHLYPEWVQGGPTGCRYNRSKTGWFDSIIFEDWFFKIALPYLRHKQGPKLLVGDNLRSHVSQKVIKSCEDNDIRFTFFLPNSTHRCQPLDLSFFRSLKSSWRNVITEWKLRNTGCIPKTVFPSLLLKTLEGLQNIERIIKSGFRAAGIHPLNRQEVLKHFPSAEVDNIRDDALLASFSEIMDNATLVQTNSAAKRSTKILIPAGKSVSSKARNEEEEDIEVESEDDQEEVKEAEDQQNEAESMEDEADDVSSNEEEHEIDCVIHFAAMKAVGESMEQPLLYYKNNLIGMLNLLEVMEQKECFQLVFSSSCTVYGEPTELPITENHKIGGNITNVYGKTKYFIEEMLKDITYSNKKWNIIALRYFNPVGAHSSGLIGEDPTKLFTNIMPYIAQVAIGRKPLLTIFGGDYNTSDGTGVRDYIHVMDLASGHVAALNLLSQKHQHLKVYNLGTGKGVTVLQLVKTFEEVTGSTIKYEIVDRRDGDISIMYANTDLAERELGWKAQHSLADMCADFWRWQKTNPNGYRTKNGLKTNGHP